MERHFYLISAEDFREAIHTLYGPDARLVLVTEDVFFYEGVDVVDMNFDSVIKGIMVPITFADGTCGYQVHPPFVLDNSVSGLPNEKKGFQEELSDYYGIDIEEIMVDKHNCDDHRLPFECVGFYGRLRQK